ncbi:hypothetical protein PRIPAC_79879 [Pristionchus pacificus]|uniref:Uncharacterized protein n=1 Tax=Pristionchus pacificus TaxID=54126 RepID=A0A2A6CNB3_PRIPA|nr:hypothetical protein PRIPAC_79879 [Pristionchus pacificus]|eukprot:PDM79521.1 hypothetical protein PRIPAC_32100 [Pristionchus pacificus]
MLVRILLIVCLATAIVVSGDGQETSKRTIQILRNALKAAEANYEDRHEEKAPVIDFVDTTNFSRNLGNLIFMHAERAAPGYVEMEKQTKSERALVSMAKELATMQMGPE